MLQAVVACGGAGLIAGPAQALTEAEKRSLVRKTDPHTKATFRAVIDAVIPRTPELESELGTEHVPGGLENSIDLFMIKYINTLFSFGHPELGRLGNLRLAEILSVVLDLGASKLIFEGENEKPPKLSRALDLLDESWWELDLENLANGPFALLSRTDRLRALGVFDDIEFDTSELPGPLIKGDGGLITQLMVAFTEVVYYSEWERGTNRSLGHQESAGSRTIRRLSRAGGRPDIPVSLTVSPPFGATGAHPTAPSAGERRTRRSSPHSSPTSPASSARTTTTRVTTKRSIQNVADPTGRSPNGQIELRRRHCRCRR